MSKKFNIIGVFIILLLVVIADYFLLVPFAKDIKSIFIFSLLIFILSAILIPVFSTNPSKPDLWSKYVLGLISFIGLGFIIGFITTSPIFNAKDYKNLLPNPVEKEFNKEIEPFDISKAPIVTEETASRVADKQLGDYGGNLGSRAYLGDLTLQNVDGSLYWVAPIEHKNFFSWFNNKNLGTPYIMVNANNKESKIIDGKLKYQPKSFFNQDLQRTLYFNDPTKLYSDFTFEVNDDLKPYYTATIYKNTIGLSGQKAMGVALVDAQSGKIEEYSTANAPKWVDRIQPLDFVRNNINLRGEYIRGFSPFNDNGKLKATEGVGMVYNEGRCYFYTGITSIGKDDSSLGFYLVDTRTMETIYFKSSGATEKASMNSAEGKVQHLGYTGSFPILMRVENTPTYFIPLQDKNNLTKSYAMVNVEDYTLIGVGENVEETRNNYIKTLSSKNILINSGGDKKELSGKILRINSFVQDGDTYYSILLDSYNKIITSSLTQSQELPLTKEGDSVKITYIPSSLDITQSISFDNLSILE